ncbi:MAG: sensor histidine kinase, partial [Candidatus Zixiibacteriota bacterium]
MAAQLSQRRAFIVFISMVIFAFAQAVWWIIFMAMVVGEKVDMARQLGADPAFLQHIHQEEIKQQIMLGLEGTTFLILVLIGAWLIYRSLVRSEELKFHQQNFLMAVTHELKTPVASIKLYLESLASPKIPPEKKEAIIPRMQQDIARLEKMVERVLEAGRFNREKFHLNTEECNLSRLVHERLDLLAKAPNRVPIGIIRDVADNINIMADPLALGRAIDAVLENAVKYNDSPQVELRVSLKKTDGKAMLTIKDNGIGFNPKEHEAIFERFYR